MNHRFRRVSALALVVPLLGLAACSDDGDDAASSNEPVATTTIQDEATTTTAAPADEQQSADIVDTATKAGGFSTLLTAVKAAGLEETLRGDGPFTVFAPTDDAFAALPAGTLDQLLADPSGQLKSILTYHVVPGKVMAADVAGLDGKDVTTVNGATFRVQIGEDGGVSLTDGAGNTVKVVTTDVQASNGVIHVIDGVLLPG